MGHHREQGAGHQREHGSHQGGLTRLIRLAMMALAVTAVVRELRLAPEERTWHGTVAGFVPYEFRMPTASRVKERLWNPDGSLVGPHVFGVGWTLNVGKLVALVRAKMADAR